MLGSWLGLGIILEGKRVKSVQRWRVRARYRHVWAR